MRVNEECEDSAEPQDRFTTSKFETEDFNVASPKEDSTSEDSTGLKTTSPSVIREGLLDEAPLMAPMA